MTPATVPALQRRVAELEAKIEDMKSDKQQLTRDLRLYSDTAAEQILQARYGLTRLQACYLNLLYLQRGKPLAHAPAIAAMYRDFVDPPEEKIITVLVCKIRKRLDPEKRGDPPPIGTIHGGGYYLAGPYVRALDKVFGIENPGPVYALSEVDLMPPKAPQQGQVMLRGMRHLAKAPSSSTRLAAVLERPVYIVSSLVSRMRSMGLVEDTGRQVEGRKVYAVTPFGRQWIEDRGGLDGE